MERDFSVAYEILNLSGKIYHLIDYNKIKHTFPIVKIPEDCKVLFDFGFGGAVTRFRLLNDSETKFISFFLDGANALGFTDGSPYWEMFPTEDGDIDRVKVEDLQTLVDRAGDLLRSGGGALNDR